MIFRASPLVALCALVILGSCATPVERVELAQEYFNLGNAYFELQDYERSYQYYRRAIDLSDEIPAAGFNLARLHLERGEYQEALEVLNRLLSGDPENSLALETRAYAFYRLNDTDRARREYRELLERSAGRHRVAYNLGRLEMGAQRHLDAVSILEEHRQYAVDDAEYRWLLAEAYYLAGMDVDALQELEYYRDLAGTRMDPLSALAVRYVDWEFFLPALDVFDILTPEALEKPRTAWAQARALLRGSGEFEPGLAALERALQSGFGDSEAISALLLHLREDERDVIRDLAADYSIELPGNQEENPDPGQAE